MAAHRTPGAPTDASLDEEVTALARQIAEQEAGDAGLDRRSWWSERMLSWAMARPSFKTQLLRLVDVFPATTNGDDTLRHIHEYFDGADAPQLLALGVDVAEHIPAGGRISAAIARRNITRMGEQFIVGTTAADVAVRLASMWRQGLAATVDLLGEKTVTPREADSYAARVGALLDTLLEASRQWPPDDHLERDDLGPIPRVSVSVKPTALSPHYEPLSGDLGRREVIARLRPLLERAARAGACVWLDMEHYDVKDLTLTLVDDVLADDGLQGLELGAVVQAYLRDSLADLERLVAASDARVAAGGPPLWVRLVKGAYWDAEVLRARAEGWPVPTYEDKAETDANYEACIRFLHERHGRVRAAFGSHNLRSLAYAVTYARRLGIPDTGYELQTLFGMAEPIHGALRRLGLRLRVYSPMGELVPGMSYLVRRLLENTANDSFVRRRFTGGRPLDELLAPPSPASRVRDRRPPARDGRSGPARLATDGLAGSPGLAPPSRRFDPGSPGPYVHEPAAEWRQEKVRDELGRALSGLEQWIAGNGHDARHRSAGSGDGSAGPERPGSSGFWGSPGLWGSSGPLPVPAVVGGRELWAGEALDSVDPARPSFVVARAASCGPEQADAAVAAALKAWPGWSGRGAVERSAVCFRAAAWFRGQRAGLAALEVLEAGRPWPEADADVTEAIDFCEYYGREALRLAAGAAVQSPPGEINSFHYQGKGVVAVISPWNFPLAIPTGIVAAALVAGNSVVLKPAEQTPATARMLVEAFRHAGLPPGILNLVPGVGEVAGDRLVRHPDVAVVAFTGSLEVGLSINAVAAERSPGQRHIKRVVAELGGKNAIVVDADADLDQAVPAIVASAFGFAGQKCSAASRVVVVESVAETLLERLVGAAGTVVVGPPRHPATVVGPLIDAEAQARVLRAVGAAPAQGTVLLARTDVPGEGWFVGPHVVAVSNPTVPLARDEIFGPVLTVLIAPDFEQAIRIAGDTPFALTAGLFSRSPAHIAAAATELRAGNVYINRGITGAVPGRQPFGGYGLSGVGSKAGGPDYLLQFVDPRTVTENTVRQGFAPDS